MLTWWDRLCRAPEGADAGAGAGDAPASAADAAPAGEEGGASGGAPPSGEPGRPAWLPEKFESPEKLAESYAQLERRFGQKNDALKAELLAELRKEAPEAPDGYVFKVDPGLAPEGYEVGDFDQSSPLMGEVRTVMHELGASQKQVDRLVQAYVREQFRMLPDLAAEKAKLGEGADARLAEVQQRLGVLVTDEGERGVLMQLCATAAGVSAMERLLAKVQAGGPVPMPSGGGGGTTMTPAEMTEAMSSPDYHHATRGAALRERVSRAIAAGVRPAGYTPRF